LRVAGYLGALAIPLAIYGAMVAPGEVRPTMLGGAGALWIVVVMLSALATRSPADSPLTATSVTVFGVAYAALLPAFLLGLRETPVAPDAFSATWLTFLPLVLTWLCDTAAMLAGVAIGGKKLAPVVSPNKTWAGGIAGLVVACVAAPFYGAWLLGGLARVPSWWQLAIVGAVVGVFGQIGDIAESLFKREAGVKDSGTLLPGHGGMLDRLDSLYWVIPLSVFTLKVVGVL
jgi:phosphatidate cytidylyltransferase